MPKRCQNQELQVEYTEEMRQRALAVITERNAREDRELLFREYMETMFRAFCRRLRREHPLVV